MSFGALTPEFSSYEKSKVVILPIPYEGTVTYGKGTAKGPAAIIKASQNMELYDIELDKEPFDAGIHTHGEIESAATPEEEQEKIYSAAKQLVEDGKFVIGLGGEHSITNAFVRAYKEKFKDLTVLSFDAHTDLRDEYEGNKLSHASVMARVLDQRVNVVEVGVRSSSSEEKTNIARVPLCTVKDVNQHPDWIKKLIDELGDNVYISFDVDVLDPSIMPATGTPEPGGMTWEQVNELLEAVCKEKNVIGADFVELSPFEGLEHADFIVAKLIYRLIGYKF